MVETITDGNHVDKQTFFIFAKSLGLIIAIDGYSSTGKSTLAKHIAKTLKYRHVDSGAMYRAVTLFAIDNQIFNDNQINEKELINRLNDVEIDFFYDGETSKNKTLLNGKDVEEEIRGMAVSKKVSQVAKIEKVRKFLVRKQQEIGANGNIVMDGRDIGTVVFPTADFKFFVTASPEIRAQRRYKELIDLGKVITYEEVVENINNRDMIDLNREHSPLKQAEDAIVIDNSNLTKEETIQLVLSHIQNQ